MFLATKVIHCAKYFLLQIMARVSTCPKNLTEVEVAATRLNCSVDYYGNSQYMCVPNVEKTSLVEFCYNDTLGIRQKGMELIKVTKFVI